MKYNHYRVTLKKLLEYRNNRFIEAGAYLPPQKGVSEDEAGAFDTDRIQQNAVGNYSLLVSNRQMRSVEVSDQTIVQIGVRDIGDYLAAEEAAHSQLLTHLDIP